MFWLNCLDKCTINKIASFLLCDGFFRGCDSRIVNTHTHTHTQAKTMNKTWSDGFKPTLTANGRIRNCVIKLSYANSGNFVCSLPRLIALLPRRLFKLFDAYKRTMQCTNRSGGFYRRIESNNEILLVRTSPVFGLMGKMAKDPRWMATVDKETEREREEKWSRLDDEQIVLVRFASKRNCGGALRGAHWMQEMHRATLCQQTDVMALFPRKPFPFTSFVILAFVSYHFQFVSSFSLLLLLPSISLWPFPCCATALPPARALSILVRVEFSSLVRRLVCYSLNGRKSFTWQIIYCHVKL